METTERQPLDPSTYANRLIERIDQTNVDLPLSETLIRTQQDGTASRSVTWGFGSAGNGTIRWAEGGTAPTGTEYPAGVADVYGFIAIATGAFDGFVIGNDLK